MRLLVVVMRRRRGADLDPEHRITIARQEIEAFATAVLGMVEALKQAINAYEKLGEGCRSIAMEGHLDAGRQRSLADFLLQLSNMGDEVARLQAVHAGALNVINMDRLERFRTKCTMRTAELAASTRQEERVKQKITGLKADGASSSAGASAGDSAPTGSAGAAVVDSGGGSPRPAGPGPSADGAATAPTSSPGDNNSSTEPPSPQGGSSKRSENNLARLAREQELLWTQRQLQELSQQHLHERQEFETTRSGTCVRADINAG